MKRTRFFCGQASTHSPVARCVVPVPHSFSCLTSQRTASFSVVLACPFSFGRRSVFGEIATKRLIDRRRILE